MCTGLLHLSLVFTRADALSVGGMVGTRSRGPQMGFRVVITTGARCHCASLGLCGFSEWPLCQSSLHFGLWRPLPSLKSLLGSEQLLTTTFLFIAWQARAQALPCGRTHRVRQKSLQGRAAVWLLVPWKHWFHIVFLVSKAVRASRGRHPAVLVRLQQGVGSDTPRTGVRTVWAVDSTAA